jgi:hypothetical protein
MNSHEIKVSGTKELEKNIELPSGVISGVVRDEVTFKPLSEVRIVLQQSESTSKSEFLAEAMGDRMAEAYTDENGRFEISDLSHGIYHLRAGGGNLMGMDSGGYAARHIKNIEIGKASEKRKLQIDLFKGGNLEGRVTDSQGTGIQGVSVFLKIDDQPDFEAFTECRTDATGFYNYIGIAPGRCAVRFTHPDYVAEERPSIWIESNESTTQNVKMTKL